MAERWVWYCGYDRGHGQDREVCSAQSRKPVSSESRARAGLQAHFARSPFCTRDNYGYSNNGRIRRLAPGERWRP